MTIKDVANQLGVGWDFVKGLKKQHLERQFRQPKLRRLGGWRSTKSTSAAATSFARWCSLSTPERSCSWGQAPVKN
jgi:hypothetical protein